MIAMAATFSRGIPQGGSDGPNSVRSRALPEWPLVSAHVRNDMGPTPQWVWNLFIGIGALTGLILFASAISYESSSKKEIEQIKASREPDHEGPYGLESWQKAAY